MYSFQCKAWLLAVIIVWLIVSGQTRGDSIVRPVATTPVRAPADPFSIGRSLIRPETLTVPTLEELVDRAAGSVSRRAFERFGGDFEAYWKVAQKQRTGKAYEALLAYRENQHNSALGRQGRSLVTAVEKGGSHHPADILDLGEDGRITARRQSKLGWRSAIKALDDSKYTGMRIVTPPESLAIIDKELLRAEQKAARRGIELPDKWVMVKQSLDDGRLMRTSASGAALPTEAEALEYARKTAKLQWREMERMQSLARVGKVAGKVLIVVDVAGTVYFTYHDVRRFQAGEIGGGYLAGKSTLRGTQLALLTYAVYSPEPFSKTVAAVTVVVLVVADVASDVVHEKILASQQQMAQQLLNSIDKEERYHTTRCFLLAELSR